MKTNDILSLLNQAEGYLSGERISKELGISRAAVWKHISKLRQEGYEIQSVTNKGYRLTGFPDRLTEAEITKDLPTTLIGRQVFSFDQVDSTNEEAKRNSGQPDGSVFVSEIQTLGKGRRGRTWSSPPGTGIWFSLLLKPDIAPDQVSQITLIAGLAVCKAVGAGAGIKWPNDVVINGKKICGILTELSAEIEQINYVVCGIGINANIEAFPEELSEKATSLILETGEKQDRATLLKRVLIEFESCYLCFLNNGLAGVLEDYKANCLTLNKEVQVIFPKETFCAYAFDVDKSGSLMVRTEDGAIRTINAGEVSVRGIYGYL